MRDIKGFVNRGACCGEREPIEVKITSISEKKSPLIDKVNGIYVRLLEINCLADKIYEELYGITHGTCCSEESGKVPSLESTVEKIGDEVSELHDCLIEILNRFKG